MDTLRKLNRLYVLYIYIYKHLCFCAMCMYICLHVYVCSCTLSEKRNLKDKFLGQTIELLHI